MTMLNDGKDMYHMDLLTFRLAGQDGHSHGTRDTTPFHSWRGQGGKSEMAMFDDDKKAYRMDLLNFRLAGQDDHSHGA